MNRLRSLVAAATLCALVFGTPGAQPGPAAPIVGECGSDVTPEEAQRYLDLLDRGIPQAPFAQDPPYCVPIMGHIVRSSLGTGGLSLSRYQQAIQDANDAFANTGMVFYSIGVDYIDDDTYYIATEGSELTTLRQTNVIPAAINVYFVPNAVGLCGISSFTFSSTQGIIQDNDCTGLPSNPSTFPHEIGHYFNLFHTHETAFGQEFVNGSNCASAGDQLCDTPADPVLSGRVNGACQYTGGPLDPNGQPYSPDPNQYMSYSVATCRNVFSPQSETKMVETLLNLRPELLSRGCSPQGNASVTQADPPDAFTDETLDVVLVGANLGIFTAVFFGDGITVNQTDSISSDSLLVSITVDADAVLGPRDIIVNNLLTPDTLEAGFSVVPTTFHYVSPNGSNNYPYATPGDAAPSLADVLAAASSGDSVLVDTTTVTNVSASTLAGLTISGGWMNNFTTRDLSFKRTTLELNNNISLGPSVDPIVFDGFHLKDGNGTTSLLPVSGKYGGGIIIAETDVTVTNCVIENCVAAPGSNYGAGGGVSARSSTVTIADNTISGNSATVGGGIYLYDCDGSVSGNVITLNSVSLGAGSDPFGAGIFVDASNGLNLSNNTVDSNSGANSGGGIRVVQSTGITLDGGTLSNHSVTSNGGGADLVSSEVTLSGVRFVGNASSLIGGALRSDATDATVSDCDFIDNTAAVGAGLYMNVGESYLNHNLFANNVASVSGGGAYLASPSAGRVVGNTLDNNSGGTAGGVVVSSASIDVFNNIIVNSGGAGLTCAAGAPVVQYNLVWNSSGDDYSGCAPGTGAVSGDPMFADPGTEDYRLTLNSPAIDAGEPSAANNDPDGSRGDMGRFGSHAFAMAQPAYPQGLVADFTGGNVVLTWIPNTEGDIDYYAIYCDTISGFTPGPGNFVTTSPDSSVDLGAPADTAYYRVSAVDLDGYASGYSDEASSEPPITTAAGGPLRYQTALGQNRPNPFNPETTIRYTLAERANVQLTVYDVAGRKVRTLVDESRAAGPHEAFWDGRSDNGQSVATGVYFYRLVTGNFSQTRKMVLLK